MHMIPTPTADLESDAKNWLRRFKVKESGSMPACMCDHERSLAAFYSLGLVSSQVDGGDQGLEIFSCFSYIFGFPTKF